jgi:hypothetical protein
MRKAIIDESETQAPPLIPPPPPPVTKQTVTTTTVGPPAPMFALPAQKPQKEHVNSWFSKLDPAYRLNHCAFYLYRLDPNITIVNPDLEGRANGSMLDRLEAEVIGQFTGDNFLADLQVWTKQKYGGGNFEIQINDKKQHKMMYDIGFKIEGAPVLSSREAYTAGPTGAQTGMDGGTIGMLIKYFDEKLQNIKAGTQDPGIASQQMANAIMQSNSEALKFALASQPKAATPEEQLLHMGKMFEMFKNLQPQPAAPAAPAKTMAENLQELSAMMDVMEKLRGKATPAENPQTIAAAIAEGIAKAGIGRSKGADYAWLLELGKVAMPFLAPLGAALAEKIRQAPTPGHPQAARRIASVPVNPQPAAPAGGAVPSGGAMPGGGAASGAMPGMAHAVPVGGNGQPSTPAPAAPAAQPADAQRELTQEDVNLVAQHIISTRLVDMLLHDRTGEDAAASIQDMFPEAAIRMRFATVEILQSIVVNDPILSQVKDDPRLPAFLQSFYDFFHPNAEEEETQAKVN